MFKVGIAGIRDAWSTQRLIEAFHRRGCIAHLIEPENLALDLDTGNASCGQVDLRSLDALVIKKIGTPYAPALLDRLAALCFLRGTGIPVFSHPCNVKRVIDRLSCTVTLRLSGIPMPPTRITENVERAVEAVSAFGRAVLKPLYTSKARGMVVVEAGDGARATVEQYKASGNRTLYVQKMVELPGRDVGLVYVGGEYLGAYARVKCAESWNTSTSSGGRYEAYSPASSLIELGRRAQAPFELAFTCVDVALTDDGPVVFEVSAFGGFRGLWEAHGVNAARPYVAYVLGRLADAR